MSPSHRVPSPLCRAGVGFFAFCIGLFFFWARRPRLTRRVGCRAAWVVQFTHCVRTLDSSAQFYREMSIYGERFKPWQGDRERTGDKSHRAMCIVDKHREPAVDLPPWAVLATRTRTCPSRPSALAV